MGASGQHGAQRWHPRLGRRTPVEYEFPHITTARSQLTRPQESRGRPWPVVRCLVRFWWGGVRISERRPRRRPSRPSVERDYRDPAQPATSVVNCRPGRHETRPPPGAGCDCLQHRRGRRSGEFCRFCPVASAEPTNAIEVALSAAAAATMASRCSPRTRSRRFMGTRARRGETAVTATRPPEGGRSGPTRRGDRRFDGAVPWGAAQRSQHPYWRRAQNAYRRGPGGLYGSSPGRSRNSLRNCSVRPAVSGRSGGSPAAGASGASTWWYR